VLETHGVSIRFGGVQALNDVNLRVEEHEIVGIIGPNGAGKTTLFNCITGFYEPTDGRVLHRGRDITDLPVHRRAALGLGRTFQNVGLVKGSTVLENIKTAQHLEIGYDPFAGMFASPRSLETEREITERAHAILGLVGLDHLAETRVQGLPYGVLKRLELAVVLATDPDVILLDEPGSGHGSRGGRRAGRPAARPAGALRRDHRDDRPPRPAGDPGVGLRVLPQLRRGAGRGPARRRAPPPRGRPRLPGRRGGGGEV
jgi:branched-chain amino acid transport system ATP-binding protein